MDQTKLCGTQSLHFQRPAYILSAASVAGKKEAEGPLGKKFDMVDEQDNLFGAKTWEEAESNMQKEACILAIGKAGLKPEKIRYLFGGDLLRQWRHCRFLCSGFTGHVQHQERHWHWQQ